MPIRSRSLFTTALLQPHFQNFAYITVVLAIVPVGQSGSIGGKNRPPSSREAFPETWDNLVAITYAKKHS